MFAIVLVAFVAALVSATQIKTSKQQAPLVALAKPQDGMCSVCEAVVGFVESYVEQNATMAEIQARLDAVCALAGPYASECTQLVDQYLPQIVQWVEKNETPANVCMQLQLCTNAHAALALALHKAAAIATPQDGFCSVCEAIVGFAEAYVEQNSTVAQIEARLDALCALAGPFAQECTTLVSQYLPQIIQWLEKNETPAQICAKIGVCTNNAKLAVQPLVAIVAANNGAVGASVGCAICKTIVGYVEAYVQQNATLTQIEQQLKKICALVKPIEAICDNLVDNELPTIIAQVLKKQSPTTICDDLKLCDNGTLLAVAALPVPALDLVHPTQPQDGFCSICTAIVGFVESYLEQNATIAQIEARLDALCALAGPYASECTTLVNSYLPQIVQWVEKNETPQDICTKLGVCTMFALAQLKAPQQGTECVLCKLVVGYVETYLANNATEAQIATRIKKLCQIVGPLEMVCDDIVDNELPQIINDLENNETPNKVCDQISLCDNGTLVASVAAPQDGFCSVCTAIVGFVESYVEQNATIAQIEARLDALCALAGPYASQCVALVNAYLPQIIQWVEKNETPQDICTKLGVCTNFGLPLVTSKEGLAAFTNALNLAAKVNPELCAVCEAVVALGDHYVAQNQTVAFVESELEKVCALAGAYESICDGIVESYTGDLAQYVQRKASPSVVCQDLALCSAK